jgi:hypothetical protein
VERWKERRNGVPVASSLSKPEAWVVSAESQRTTSGRSEDLLQKGEDGRHVPLGLDQKYQRPRREVTGPDSTGVYAAPRRSNGSARTRVLEPSGRCVICLPLLHPPATAACRNSLSFDLGRAGSRLPSLAHPLFVCVSLCRVCSARPCSLFLLSSCLILDRHITARQVT